MQSTTWGACIPELIARDVRSRSVIFSENAGDSSKQMTVNILVNIGSFPV